MKLYLYRFIKKEKRKILKVKINDIENRLREVEAKRGQLMLDYEKDKAKFSLEKDHWESKTKDSASFPYHRDTILIADTPKDTKKKKSPKDLEEPSLPDVVKKRLCIPFEFRFINQDVSNFA